MILPRRGECVDRERRAGLRKMLKQEFMEQRIDRLKSINEIRLSDTFTDEDVHRLCRELGMKFRERCFPPAVALGMSISQALSRNDACTTIVMELNRERLRLGLPPVCTNASAYCKARAKLPVQLIDTLSNRVAQIAHNKTPSSWKWRGLNAYLVDGLVLRAPDTKANQEGYPQPSSQEEGLGFPQVRMVMTVSLATGCITAYNTGPVEGKRTGEVSLFREKHGEFVAGDVIVADANFESFHDAALLNNRGVALVCCINGTRKTPFTGPCQAIEDTLVTIYKPKFDQKRFTIAEWKSLPDSLTYRVIRYRVRGRSSEITIVTTLLDAKLYPAEEIIELYGLRWDVELDIRSYKCSMGLCELRCQTPANLDREIAFGVLAYNLVRSLICDGAAVIGSLHPREISFNLARDAYRSLSDQLVTTPGLAAALLAATSHFVRDRPNRDEPRAIKKRCHTKYPKLSAPRPSRARRGQIQAENSQKSQRSP